MREFFVLLLICVASGLADDAKGPKVTDKVNFYYFLLISNFAYNNKLIVKLQ